MSTEYAILPCEPGKHVHPEYEGVTGSGGPGPFYWRINCGTEDDPEWFTCCDINQIRQRASSPDRGVPFDEAMRRMFGDDR